MEGVVGAAIVLLVVLAVIVDTEARTRGQTDPRWRRVGSVLHSVLGCLVVGVLGGIGFVVLVLWIFRPIGGP